MKKTIGFWQAWALVVGTMIGSGVFLLPAVLAPYGSLSLWGWLIAGGGTLFIALSLGSLARRIPKIGGPYAYTRAAFGDLPGFLIAWGYWICLWSATAAVAVAFSGYMSVFIPAFASNPVVGAAGALVFIWLMTGVNLAGVGTAGIVQLVTTLLKLLPLFIIALGGLVLGDVTAIPAVNPDNEPFPLLIAGIAMLTMWAYVGVEAATVPAENVIEPERTIPRALIIGSLTATGVYILATMGIMALVPTSDLAESSSPFADAASVLLGPWGGGFVAIGAIVSITGANNATILISGQTPLAAALDGLFPARFKELNANGAPGFALVVSSALASLLIVLNYTRGLVAAFEFLILLSTLTTLIPYAASAAADYVLHHRAVERGEEPRQWKTLIIAVVAFVFSVFAIIGSGLEVVAYGILLLIAGLPVYYWTRKRTGVAPETA